MARTFTLLLAVPSREDRRGRILQELIMTPVADDLSATIHLEFDLACRDLVEAERAVAARDDVVSRAHLRACWERVDAVLDMWNDAAGGPA